jgi:hypothetical protein
VVAVPWQGTLARASRTKPMSATCGTSKRHFVADEKKVDENSIFHDWNGQFGRMLRPDVIRLVDCKPIPASFGIPNHAILNQRSALG